MNAFLFFLLNRYTRVLLGIQCWFSVFNIYIYIYMVRRRKHLAIWSEVGIVSDGSVFFILFFKLNYDDGRSDLSNKRYLLF